MKNLKIALSLVALSIFSLQSFMTIEPTEATIHGVWVNHSYKDGLSIYKKVDSFKEDKPGFQFNEDGTLLKRQNVGWCGTPPISYGNFDGQWKEVENNLIQMEYDYWGGRDTLTFEIVSLSPNKMKLKRVMITEK